MKQYTKPKKIISTLRLELCGDNHLTTKGFLRGLFLANHLASTDNLTRATKRENAYKCKLTQ